MLDLRGGRAVHARGGTRAGYRPVAGELGVGDDPVALARGLRDRFGFREVYVADLDAIEGGAAALGVVREVASLGLAVTADVGPRDAQAIAALRAHDVARVVAPTETLAGPAALAGLVRAAGAENLLLGLDLREGVSIVAPGAGWPAPDAPGIVAAAVAEGITGVLILDLGRIGAGRGVGTIGLAARLRREAPGLEVLVGGGVSGPDDVAAVRDAGLDGVLVASALHDGRIRPDDLARLMTPPAG